MVRAKTNSARLIFVLGLCLSSIGAAASRVCTPLFRDFASRGEYRELVKLSLYVAESQAPFRAKDSFFFEKDIEKLAPFEALSTEAQERLLLGELIVGLENGFGYIPEGELDAFRKTVRQFILDGGFFHITRNAKAEGAQFSVVPSGAFLIQIPFLELVSSQIELSSGGRQNLVRTLVHELRHYVTHRRQVEALRERQVAEPETYLSRMADTSPTRLAAFISQMEQEAKAAERKFVPGAREKNQSGFLYAEAEAIQRYLKTLELNEERDIEKRLGGDATLNRLGDALATAVLGYYTHFSGKEIPSSLKHDLGGYLAARAYVDKEGESRYDFPFEYTVGHGNVEDALDSIYGRVPKEQIPALKKALEKRLILRKREIIQAIEQLLSEHPEIKAWGSN